MTDTKNVLTDEIKDRLISDASNPDAWESVGTVSPSTAPRPSWYGTRGSSRKATRFMVDYRRHFARVVRYYARAFGMPESDAIDLAQQTFVRFYDALEHYRGEAESAFLETVVRNVEYDRIRSLKSASRSAQVISLDEQRAKRKSETNPPSGLTNRENEALRRKQLHDAIAALPDGQRHAIQLWLDGFHYSDIASALGISIAAVKSQLRDAKRHLRPDVSAADNAGPDGRQRGGVKTR